MLLQVRHETVYSYAEAVHYTIQALRLTPRREARQRVISWSIQAPGRRIEQVDAHGNIVHYLTVESPHRELRLLVNGVVETDEKTGQPNSDAMQLSPLAYRTASALTATDTALSGFAADAFAGSDDLRERLLRGAQAVAAAVAYRPGTTQVSDTAISVFQHREGVCQDQAHVFIACCRAQGFPARYVSGYLYAGSEGGVASHAWAEVWIDSMGQWYGFDITHGTPVAGQHCRLAVGRDYHDAAPVRGMRRGGGQERMQVSVTVSYSPQQ
ncbi:MAG: transglutaminase family protein [Steroidobacteraceae bacterium]